MFINFLEKQYLSAVPAQKDVSSVPPGYPTHGGGFLPSQADFQQLLDQVDASQQPLRWGPPFIMGPSGGIDVYQAHFEHLNRQLERNRGSNRRTVQQQELATTEQQQIQQQPQKHAEPYIPKFLNSMDAFSGHLLSPGWRPPAGTYGMPMRNEREVDDQGMIQYVITLRNAFVEDTAIIDIRTHPASARRSCAVVSGCKTLTTSKQRVMSSSARSP